MALRRRKLVIVLASVVAAAAVVWMVPALRARAKAIGVLTEATGIGFPRPLARSVKVERSAVVAGVVGDMYTGDEDAAVILFVPGATRRGRDDSRVVRAATSLAKANRRVFVPELALYDRTLRRSDIDRLARAIDGLSSDGPIGIVGFSYGGSFALIAAAETGGAEDVSYVATFGAYFDITNVIQAVTTGSTVLDGDNVAFETVPSARAILTRTAVDLVPDADAEPLERALKSHDPGGLRRSTKAVYDLLVNRDPAKTPELVEALPVGFKRTLADFSPSSHVEDLQVPVFIMQSKRDAATPWTEAELLGDAVPRSRSVTLEHFSHVDPPSIRGWVSDGIDAWRFVSWILEAQEQVGFG